MRLYKDNGHSFVEDLTQDERDVVREMFKHVHETMPKVGWVVQVPRAFSTLRAFAGGHDCRK